MAASSLSWRLWVDQLSGPGQPVQVTPPPPPSAVDIWSVGCIMAEMLTGKTLFKGKDYLDQLTQILKVTGVPGAEFVQKLNDKAVSGRWAQAGRGCALG